MKTRMTWMQVGVVWVIGLLIFAPSSSAATLSGVFVDAGNASLAEVQALARRQFENPETDAPKFPSDRVQRVTFTGWFVPASNQTRLAVFSDDGVDIFIDGKRYLPWRLGRGQHLPKMTQSFRLVRDTDPNNWRNEIFVANQVYHIRIEYSNILYVEGTPANNYFVDIDGCTLFAFNGGGRIFDLEMVTPAGDPVNAPVDEGDGQNEFTFSAANPGVLTINFKARVVPNEQQNIDFFDDKVAFTVDNIGTSTKQWAATNPNGKATRNGNEFLATVTFTGLPANNSDFGAKKASVQRLTRKGDEAVFEVFFPRDATNHPDLPNTPDLGNFSATNQDTAGRGDSTRSPNWFFYWNRTVAGNPNARFDSTLGGGFFGQTPAIFNWLTYTGPRERILVSSATVGRDSRRDGSNQIVTGIDLFRTTLLHEQRHVVQVLEHNALNPWNVAVGGARIGWSFADNGVPLGRTRANIQAGRYNHFRAGADGGPGVAGVDDDGDGTIDELDEFIAGPPNPAIPGDAGSVVGDDLDLDRDGDCISPLVPTGGDPNPNTAEELVESQANAAETNPQDGLRQLDWGNPGKQHGPNLIVPNADGELNRYDD